jgi:hypothetical protein
VRTQNKSGDARGCRPCVADIENPATHQAGSPAQHRINLPGASTPDRVGRTWNTPGGPMVEPEPPTWIDEQVRRILAELTPAARKILEVQGRYVSARIAAARTHQERLTEGYQVAAAAAAKHRLPPRGSNWTPRVLWRDAEEARRWPRRADSVTQAHEARRLAEARRISRLAALACSGPGAGAA